MSIKRRARLPRSEINYRARDCGRFASVPFVVKVNATLNKTITTIQNTAQIGIANNGVELSLLNNSKTSSTPVKPGPELVIR